MGKWVCQAKYTNSFAFFVHYFVLKRLAIGCRRCYNIDSERDRDTTNGGKKMNEWFCTVFPYDPDEMPQDFESYAEAKEYGDKMFGKGNYILESPC